jgi:hypothetical protein
MVPDPDFLPIPDSGVKKAPDPGSVTLLWVIPSQSCTVCTLQRPESEQVGCALLLRESHRLHCGDHRACPVYEASGKRVIIIISVGDP